MEYCCCCSIAQLCPILCDPKDCSTPASLSLNISWSLPKFMFIASVIPSSHLIQWHPLLLLPSIFPSIRDFSNESVVCIRWPKYWNFRFGISPSDKYSVWMYLKIEWFGLLAVQGPLRSLLRHRSLPCHGEGACVIWWSYEPCCMGSPKTGHSREFWQNVICWRREWQTTPVNLLWEPHELYKRTMKYFTDLKRKEILFLNIYLFGCTMS